MGYVFHARTEDDLLFWQWWGRYVMDMTDEEMAGGATTATIMRAAEAAWKASAITPRRPVRTRKSRRKPTA